VNAVLRPAAEFALGELAALYAATRRDYLVSLPMDAAGLAAYLARGSVSLAHSWVAVNRHGRPLGMLLLGLRGERAWLTRMGVLPHARRDGLGGLLLQMIEGNAPALALFTRFGFVPRRLLRVLDRAGGPAQDAGAAALPLSALALAGWLERRRLPGPHAPSWLDEADALRAVHGLEGLVLEHSALLYARDAARLSPLALLAADHRQAVALLGALFSRHAPLPARYENLPATHPLAPALYAAGFRTAFTRIEMTCALAENAQPGLT
jgi:GNAT superfamily N-acetyltransferase